MEVLLSVPKVSFQTTQELMETLGLENEVVRIDRENKLVEINDLINNTSYTETFDKLVVSPGAEPIKPPIPGIKDKAIFTVRNVNDTDKIKTYIKENKTKKAEVVGADFIGLEMADSKPLYGAVPSRFSVCDTL